MTNRIMALPSPWRETDRQSPCPICHRAGCLVAADSYGPFAAICRYTPSSRPIDKLGYVHVIDAHTLYWSGGAMPMHGGLPLWMYAIRHAEAS